jgi:hypothetical protein
MFTPKKPKMDASSFEQLAQNIVDKMDQQKSNPKASLIEEILQDKRDLKEAVKGTNYKYTMGSNTLTQKSSSSSKKLPTTEERNALIEAGVESSVKSFLDEDKKEREQTKQDDKKETKGDPSDYINPEITTEDYDFNLPFAELAPRSKIEKDRDNAYADELDSKHNGPSKFEKGKDKLLEFKNGLTADQHKNVSDIVSSTQAGEMELKDVLPNTVSNKISKTIEEKKNDAYQAIMNMGNGYGLEMSDIKDRLDSLSSDKLIDTMKKLSGIGHPSVSEFFDTISDSVFGVTESKVSSEMAQKFSDFTSGDARSIVRSIGDSAFIKSTLDTFKGNVGTAQEALDIISGSLPTLPSQVSSGLKKELRNQIGKFFGGGGLIENLNPNIRNIIKRVPALKDIMIESMEESRVARIGFEGEEKTDADREEKTDDMKTAPIDVGPGASSSSESSSTESSSTESSIGTSSMGERSLHDNSSKEVQTDGQNISQELLDALQAINPNEKGQQKPAEDVKEKPMRFPNSSTRGSNTRLVQNSINNYLTDINLFGDGGGEMDDILDRLTTI